MQTQMRHWMYLSGVFPSVPRGRILSTILEPFEQSKLAEARKLFPHHDTQLIVKDGGILAGIQAESFNDVSELLTSTQAAVSARSFRSWVPLRSVEVYDVRGRVFVEDMTGRHPNDELRVECDAAVTEEQLYALFRPFGKISDIVLPAPGSKEPASIIRYSSIPSAVSAKLCLHGFALSSISRSPHESASNLPSLALDDLKDVSKTFRIQYVPRDDRHRVSEFYKAHQKILLPLLIAFLGTSASFLFDPIRELFVKIKVENLKQSKLVRWLEKETLGRLGLQNVKQGSIDGDIEHEREKAKNQLEDWLRDPPDTFILLAGARGSGKEALLNDVLDSPSVSCALVIDVEELLQAARSNEPKLISSLASSVGYFPQFSFLSSISTLIDVAAVGVIGTKTGLATSVDEAIKTILETTASVLRKQSNDIKQRQEREVARMRLETIEVPDDFVQKGRRGIRDARLDAVSGNGVISELGGGVELEMDQIVIVGPVGAAKAKMFSGGTKSEENKVILPVVVIKNFAEGAGNLDKVLCDALAEFAARLVTAQVANVIFLTSQPSLARVLSPYLPSKPFLSIALDDATAQQAIAYLGTQLSPLVLPPDAQIAVAQLGGRRTDLELLLSKLRTSGSDDSPLDVTGAVDEIVRRAADELRKNYLEGSDRFLAWKIMRGLTKGEGQIKYGEALFSLCGGNEKALNALENEGLLITHFVNGRPSLIKPGKPVYRPAFELLLNDEAFAATIDYAANDSARENAEKDLAAASQELIALSSTFANGWKLSGGVPVELSVATQRLLGRMSKAETTLEQLEKEKEELLVILSNAV